MLVLPDLARPSCLALAAGAVVLTGWCVGGDLVVFRSGTGCDGRSAEITSMLFNPSTEAQWAETTDRPDRYLAAALGLATCGRGTSGGVPASVPLGEVGQARLIVWALFAGSDDRALRN